MATIKGYKVPVDREGRVNLTYLWQLAGRPDTKRPSRYKDLKRARVLLADAMWMGKASGCNRSCWARCPLALDYADYLELQEADEINRAPSSESSPSDDIDRQLREIQAATERMENERKLLEEATAKYQAMIDQMETSRQDGQQAHEEYLQKRAADRQASEEVHQRQMDDLAASRKANQDPSEAWKDLDGPPLNEGDEWMEAGYEEDDTTWRCEPEPRPTPYFAPGTIVVEGGNGAGPDRLFMTFTDAYEFLPVRASVN